MIPQHHPSEETLLVHAAGGFGDGMAFVLASHLDCCESCRTIIAAAEAVGGVLLEEIAPETVSAETRCRVVATIEREGPFEQLRHASPFLATRGPLADLLEEREPSRGWTRLSPGVDHLLVSPELRLIRAEAGCCVPIHGHAGSELSLVLEGSYFGEHGLFGPGDLAEFGDDATRSPLADQARGCLLLVASDGPYRPAAWLGRTIRRWSSILSAPSG